MLTGLEPTTYGTRYSRIYACNMTVLESFTHPTWGFYLARNPLGSVQRSNENPSAYTVCWIRLVTYLVCRRFIGAGRHGGISCHEHRGVERRIEARFVRIAVIP